MDEEIARLFVRIGADISEMSAGFNKALSETNSFASGLKSAGSKLTSVGKELTEAFTVPLTLIGAGAIKASTDFQSAFGAVERQVKATTPQFAEMRKGIIDMSKELPLSASKIADVVAQAGKLGIQTSGIMAFTKTMVMLGETTDMSAKQAATSMVQLANVMQLPQSQIGNLASELVALQDTSAGTASEITDIAMRIASVGQEVGLTTPQVLALAAAMTDLGLSQLGAQAVTKIFVDMNDAVNGTQTAAQLQAIADQEQAVAQASQHLSDAQYSAAQAGQNLKEAQYNVGQALQGVKDAQYAATQSAQGLKDAHYALGQAQQGLADANRNLRNAMEDATRAQRNLTQANFDARRETLSVAEAQQHLSEVQAGAPQHALDLRAATVAVAEAQQRRSQVQKDAKHTSTDLAAADLALDQAQQRLNLVNRQGPQYALDLANAQLTLQETTNRVGTAARNYADQKKQADQKVIDSQHGVTAAQHGVQEAQLGILNAQHGVQQSTLAIADANHRYEQSQIAVSDASHGVVRANQEVGAATVALQNDQQKLTNLTDAGVAKLKIFADVSGMTVEEFKALEKSDPAAAFNAFLAGVDKMNKSGGDTIGMLEKLQLGDRRTLDTVLRLAAGHDLIAQKLEFGSQAFIENTALTEKAGKINEENAAKFEMLKNKIVDLAISLGDTLGPMLLAFMDKAQPLFDLVEAGVKIFAGLPEPIQIAVVGLAAFLAIIGPIIVILGLMVTSLGVLGVSFTGGTLAVGGFVAAFGALALAALPWIALAVVIAAGLYLLITHWDEVKAAVSAAALAIKNAAGSVLDFFRNNWKEIGTLIAGPFAPFVALATDAFGIRSALTRGLRDLIGVVGGIASDIASAISKPFEALIVRVPDIFGFKSKLESALSSLKSKAGSLASDVVGAIEGQFSKIKPPSISAPATAAPTFGPPAPLGMPSDAGSVRALPGMIASALSDAASAMSSGFTSVTSAAGGGLASLGTTIGNGLADAASTAGSGITSVVGVISSNFNAETMGKVFGFWEFLPVRIFREGLMPAHDAVSEFFTSILPNAIIGAAPSVASAIANLASSIGRGFMSVLATLSVAVGTFFSSTLPNFIASAGPLIMNAGLTLGIGMISGILVGINRNLPLIAAAPGAIAGAFVTAWNAMTATIENVGNHIVELVVSGISKAGNWVGAQLGAFARGFLGQMHSAFGNADQVLWDVGVGIVRGLLKGISDTWHELTGWLSNAIGHLPGPIKNLLGQHSPSTVFQEIGQGIVDGLALGIQGAANLIVPAPRMAGMGGVGSSAIPSSMAGMISSVLPSGSSSVPGLSALTSGGAARIGAANSGLGIEVNGPLTINNNGRRQDVNGTLGDLAFGVKGQLNRRGVYA